jgi:hypothetical protein
MNDDESYEDYSEETPTDKLDEIHSTLQEISQILPHLKTNVDVWGPVWAFIIFWLLSSWAGSKLDRWTDRVWYSSASNVNWQNIDVQKRPHTCDFFQAPIGGKGCHYKKANYSFTDADRRKLLEDATTQEERTRINNIPNSVTVYWEKKED